MIAFEIEDIPGEKKTENKADKIKFIQSITEKSLVDLSNFKFNRDDANSNNE